MGRWRFTDSLAFMAPVLRRFGAADRIDLRNVSARLDLIGASPGEGQTPAVFRLYLGVLHAPAQPGRSVEEQSLHPNCCFRSCTPPSPRGHSGLNTVSPASAPPHARITPAFG